MFELLGERVYGCSFPTTLRAMLWQTAATTAPDQSPSTNGVHSSEQTWPSKATLPLLWWGGWGAGLCITNCTLEPAHVCTLEGSLDACSEPCLHLFYVFMS